MRLDGASTSSTFCHTSSTVPWRTGFRMFSDFSFWRGCASTGILMMKEPFKAIPLNIRLCVSGLYKKVDNKPIFAIYFPQDATAVSNPGRW